MLPLIHVIVLCVLLNYMPASQSFLGLFEKFLFYPSTEVLDPAPIKGAECQVLSIKQENGKDLSCWYYKKPADNGLILVSHGNAGNISHRCELSRHLLSDTDCSVLLYDYQGYGHSEGTPSIKGILKDGIAAFDFAVKELQYPPDKIIVYGESLGCAVTCEIASQRQPRAMILQSGFRSLPTIAKDVFGPLKLMPGFAFPEPRLDNEKIVEGKHPPLLIIHGVHDEVIPFQHGQALYKKASEPKKFVVLENSGHNDTFVSDRDLFDRSISDFVRELQ